MVKTHTVEANAVISARILAALENGATVEQAINTTLGDGTYQTIVNDVWMAARARVQATA